MGKKRNGKPIADDVNYWGDGASFSSTSPRGGVMTNTLYRVSLGSLIACFALFAFHVSAQSPPTATEAFNLRIKCKKMSDKKAQESIDINTMAKWEFVAAWNTS